MDATAGTFDLVIFDRCAPKSMPDANTFFLGAVPPSLAAVEKTTVRNPIILNWTSMHPVLRYLSLEDVSIVEAFTIPLPSNARSLIESDKGPILFRLPRQGRTDIVQTFPLVGEDGNWKTDWPLKLSFPLYVMNIIRHLAGAESTEQTSYVAGLRDHYSRKWQCRDCADNATQRPGGAGPTLGAGNFRLLKYR